MRLLILYIKISLFYKMNVNRCKILLKLENKIYNNVLYWCVRDQRIQDNWGLIYAQELALKSKSSLHMCICLVPEFLNATIRQFDFMLNGVKQMEEECKNLNIHFHLLIGISVDVLPKFIKKYNIGVLIVDFYPIKIFNNWVNQLISKINIDVYQVDSHNIVPCWIASNKLEYSAKTIRNKINYKLSEYLTEFIPIIKHTYNTYIKINNNWKKAEQSLNIDRNVKPVSWAKSGTKYAFKILDIFIQNRLKDYAKKRNDPNANAISNLSPWIHFGQISTQRIILEINKYKKLYPKSVEVFCEEAIIRKELCDNFCYYNENYDNINGANNWAIKTLNEHKNDTRKHIYSLYQLENALTHDNLWNASQKQMIIYGKMHGYLRMYWAKKILEWTKSPEEALYISIYLNDKYFIDGRDPNGYVGCMWSICGIHDRAWKERPIFGKIRYMSYEGCRRKFDVDLFIKKYYKNNN
ncbi:ORF MSV235 putative CPD photolyase, similar to Monodelphis domestica GB:D31902 [Melanoplus sanguinipes entomopoxvirus]|uniref:Deoxyribodipyrimidine photo-lyase n=1 Tax=Melanoplus sanguinipes entomopoxvirus TaxID=83191 RepID=Q9YVK7_MSEPV|nr:ORF MSV235 putative CPD photolyase, similar to Monodelphis domestica GB:D31902 [Melanoplus sanguinipes entomopoxvirus]AAC97743.1 ORF MSV235 putative CPD photolyase, similar to Monodelphis domestica GB:D31902 [Melanoplus sanguinipes entomopoxvirus 'O']